MWSTRRYRPPSYYYSRWVLCEAEIAYQNILRANKLRSLRRNAANPIECDDAEFIMRYKLSKDAFKYLCTILKEKTSLRSSQRVSLELKVFCALMFYASGGYQRYVGIQKNLTQTTVSRYVRDVTDALNDPIVLDEFIKFPATREERDLIKYRFFKKYKMPGVIGCVEGSHFQILRPAKEIEHLFYCKKQYYSLNVHLICDSKGRILNVNAQYGGATHDATVWEESDVDRFMQKLHRNNEYVWLLGDSGYPQRPWLMTPIADANEGSPEAKYNAIHERTRDVVDNTLNTLKKRWRCLSKLLHYDPERCSQIIMACCVLHNLALRFTVPDPQGDEVPQADCVVHEVLREEDNEVGIISQGKIYRNILVERLLNQQVN